MRTMQNIWLATMGALVLGAPIARAQQQEPDQSTQPTQAAQPIPAYHSPLASASDNGPDEGAYDPQKLSPDTRSLTGVQDLSLGLPPLTHSYWQPRFNLNSTIDTNPLNANGMNSLTSWTSFSGGIDIHRISGNSAMTLSYLGGGSFSNDGESSNGVIQGLNFVDRFTYRRFAISIFDQLMYAPQTSFGAGDFGGGPTLPGGGSTGLGGGYAPGQTVLTARGQRITNSTDGELDVFLTGRSSLTFVGGYTLLDTIDDSQLNYGNVILSAGYNYQISRTNTFGISYLFSSFNYTNFDQSIRTNVISVSYARRITGKLAFQISGGPNVAFIRMPITPASGTPGGTDAPTTSSSTDVYAYFNSALQYQLRRATLAASYNHSVTGGSGVLAGSLTDNVSGSVSRTISRTFSGSWNVGYSRNKGLAVNGPVTANQIYDYWFTGFSLAHPIGRSLNLSLSYQLQYQTSNATICTPGAVCPTSVTRNTISFGLGWRKPPIPF